MKESYTKRKRGLDTDVREGERGSWTWIFLSTDVGIGVSASLCEILRERRGEGSVSGQNDGKGWKGGIREKENERVSLLSLEMAVTGFPPEGQTKKQDR